MIIITKFLKRTKSTNTLVDRLFEREEAPKNIVYKNINNPFIYPEPPLCSRMLVRNFINNSLYNPKFGYFSKKALIFSNKEPFNFNEIKDDLKFQNILADQYENKCDNLNEYNDISRQTWHTACELFNPWFGYSIANYIMQKIKSKNKLFNIYEVGAGNGTLMSNILDYILERDKPVYDKLRYNIIEISSNLTKKQNTSNATQKHKNIKIINKSVLDLNSSIVDPNVPAFFIFMEVLDNLAHDLVVYSAKQDCLLMTNVLTDNRGKFYEEFVEISDPFILKYLELIDVKEEILNQYKFGLVSKLYLFANKIKSKINLFCDDMFLRYFLPTDQLKLMLTLHKIYQNNKENLNLIINDFDYLDHTTDGLNSPVVQTRYRNKMLPCSTYLVKPGWFDIFFPTNFKNLDKLHQKLFDKKSIIVSQQKFLSKYADIEKSKLASGENPMLNYYENSSFLLS